MQQDSAGAAGYETVTTYNDQGFPVVVTQPAGYATAAKKYNDQGFLITPSPILDTRSTPTASAANGAGSANGETVVAAADGSSSSAPAVSKVSGTPTGAGSQLRGLGLVACAVLGAAWGLLFF